MNVVNLNLWCLKSSWNYMDFEANHPFLAKWSYSHILIPESAVSSSTLSPPTRASRRNQGKTKPRPLEMDMQLLETLCMEGDCSVDEVGSHLDTVPSAIASFQIQLVGES